MLHATVEIDYYLSFNVKLETSKLGLSAGLTNSRESKNEMDSGSSVVNCRHRVNGSFHVLCVRYDHN